MLELGPPLVPRSVHLLALEWAPLLAFPSVQPSAPNSGPLWALLLEPD